MQPLGQLSSSFSKIKHNYHMTPQFLSQLYAYEKWKHMVEQKFVDESYINVTHSSQKMKII